ncbi:DUF1513 domain-containing protein [Frigidibacter oleivorans]|uniref:DUF1513 domain-containing protein n=1 Tax=Frigidibacter oleivorans TaxID=2487129 RepID=UPI000F8EBF3A|nr:DUF1513 domain-containing protein [Frigidibacter oleivorans]
MTTRRGFLATLLAASTLPRLGWADAGSPAFLAAARDADGRFALYGVGADGTDRFRIGLPARGHAGAVHPTEPLAVAFARRPGTFAVVLNCVTGETLARLDSPAGRHFMGHGSFSPDGALLYTAENDFVTTRGKIGLWSRAEGWRRVGELESHGIGPHDVQFLPDGVTLAIANGGIETHPDRGREKLNLPTMQPSLAYLDLAGRLLDRVDLPPAWHRNSIRHLAIGPDGTVAFAMQWEDVPETAPPLLGLHRRGAAPVFAEAGEVQHRLMKGYVGSVAISRDGSLIAVSCPRGGRVQVFDRQGALVQTVERADVCGLAPLGAGFALTDGVGGLLRLEDGQLTALGARARAWDNHAVALPG